MLNLIKFDITRLSIDFLIHVDTITSTILNNIALQKSRTFIMKIERTENQLQFGNDNQYSECLELSVSDKNKINIQMSIACDEDGNGQFVSKQLTLKQFEELAKFCNEKLAQIAAQKTGTIQKIQNPVVEIQKDELKLQIHCHKDWEQPLAFTYSDDKSYLSFFADEVDLFIDFDLSFDSFGFGNVNCNSDLNYQFNDFHDKFAYLIAYTILTQQHDKFMQLIQSAHDILPFHNLYLDNHNCDHIGTWNTNIWINHSAFEFAEKMIDVQSFFKKIEQMYGLENIDDDLKNLIHQNIPLLDNVLNDDVALKKLLFGNPEINFIKVG